MWLEDHFGSGSVLQRNERVKLAASFWNNIGAGLRPASTRLLRKKPCPEEAARPISYSQEGGPRQLAQPKARNNS